MQKVRTIKSYGDGDWVFSDVELYATEMWALRARQELVRVDLHNYIDNYRDSKESNDRKVEDALLEAEKAEDHEYEDPNTWCNIHYEPQEMYYFAWNDDYSSNIQALHLSVND